jgi:hypothetical protein
MKFSSLVQAVTSIFSVALNITKANEWANTKITIKMLTYIGIVSL